MLAAPAGSNTRPTADRAKEGLFNIIAPQISGTRFLDIFCGSGAIGIEALSRGAKEAVFIENAAPAIKAVKENLTKTKLQNAEIIEVSAEKAINMLSGAGRTFDIIFLDPPYDSHIIPKTLQEIYRAGLLDPNGVIIAETEANPQTEVPGFFLNSVRVCGHANFLFYNLVRG